MTDKPYEEIFDKQELVYLTSDSDNTLGTLDQSKVYIIGGLLDHNRLKVCCMGCASVVLMCCDAVSFWCCVGVVTCMWCGVLGPYRSL